MNSAIAHGRLIMSGRYAIFDPANSMPDHFESIIDDLATGKCVELPGHDMPWWEMMELSDEMDDAEFFGED